MTTELVWTALPNGRDGDRLHLSVHVSPRLTPASTTTLADFPALASWPPADLSVRVVFPGLDPFRGSIVSEPDPALWAKLFPSTSTVRAHEFHDYSALPIHTYPITKILAFLQDQYTNAALTSPEFFPAIDDLLAGGFEDLRFSGRQGKHRWDDAMRRLRERLDRSGVVDTTAASDTTFDFVQLRDFFAPVDISDPADEDAFLQPPTLPSLDFHGAVQFCSQHPPLMRLLGLVIDVVVDLSGAPAPAGNTTVEVAPDAGVLAAVKNSTPRTHCVVDPGTFEALARPTATHLAGRYLRFDDTTQFEALQVDADGGGIKAVDLAGNLFRRNDHRTEDTPTDSALPTLRADGISVARLAQAKQLKDKLLLAKNQNADLGAGTLELWADDLVRGVRIDVWDSQSKSWHSLMRRIGTYALDGGAVVIGVDDEGFLVSNATKKPLADDLYVTEEVFTWDGWSLVAPRPGRTLNTDPADPDPMLDRPPNAPGPDFDARFAFDVAPGTLPRLRYGAEYRFRARTVDLGGNSAPADDPEATHVTPPLAFGRFEPPQTPPVLLRTPRGPGESMETVVLRSNFDAEPAPAAAERHLVPAKVGYLTAELHGRLDVPDPADPSKVVLDVGAYQTLEERDAATLLDPPAEPDPEHPGSARYYPVDELDVKYTPDPAARRLALRFLDGPNAGFVETYPLVDDAAAWPDFHALRLAVVEGAGIPSLAGRVLTVPLEKGAVVRARLSAVLDPEDLGQFGLWGWIQAAGPSPGVLAQLEKLVDTGQHWMFEPFRVLTLVHAVRQPLATPEFATTPPPSASRGLGDTWARISGRLLLSRTSTSRVDVLASWADPVDEGPGSDPPDDFAQPGSRVVADQSAFVLELEQGDELPADFEHLRHRHELGDTRHRLVTYRAIATSRFAEFFTSKETFDFEGPGSSVELDTEDGLVHRSLKLTHTLADGSTRTLVEGLHYTVDEALGTIDFVAEFDEKDKDEKPPAEGVITAVYLVPPVTRETQGPTSERVVSVPSSARPIAPRVRYAVPTFGWEQESIAGGVASTRHGNGVRIYLDRPWWSSGAGELLGVITWPATEDLLPPELTDGDPLRPYVTQWGEDPVYDAGALARQVPGLSAFPAAVAPGTALSLAELGQSGPRVNVAGHAVGYDADRDLWYCDLEVDPGSAYQPFVRLALARYQPDSVAEAHLSPVVLAEFVQLAPDRFATVVFDPADPTNATVTLSGPAPTHTEVATANPGPARVVVEQRHQPVNDPDLGWSPVGQPVTLQHQMANGVATWSGTVELPQAPGQGNVRLVLEQYELLGLEEPNPNTTRNPFVPGVTERLVYADLIVV